MNRLLTLGLLTALAASPARAQQRAPIVLELPASTRALALGGAFVTAGGDHDAIFYNPALLASARGMGAAVQRYGSASTLGVFAAAMELAPGGLGIGVQVLDYGAAPTDPGASAGLLDRGPVLASNLAATIGYARPIKGVRVGVAGKFVEQRFGEERDGAAALDIGAAANVAFVTVALAVQNLGGGLEIGGERLTLPRRVVLGAAHPSRIVGPFDLVTTAAVSALEDGTVRPALGVELAYWPVQGRTFVARAGVRRPELEGASPVTFGGAFIGDRFSVEYAYEGLEGPGGGHRVGVRWR